MKRKYSLILLILVLAISICCIFTSCKNDNSVEVENNPTEEIDNTIIADAENSITCKVTTLSSSIRYASNHNNWNIKQLIKTKDTLEQFYLDYSISGDITNYNENFFNEKTIIICLFTYSHLGAKLSIKSVQVVDNTIQIRILEKIIQNGGYAEAIDYWICILEVNNEDVKDVDVVEVNIEPQKTLM